MKDLLMLMFLSFGAVLVLGLFLVLIFPIFTVPWAIGTAIGTGIGAGLGWIICV